jgi:hypothetical protein
VPVEKKGAKERSENMKDQLEGAKRIDRDQVTAAACFSVEMMAEFVMVLVTTKSVS